jgi:2-polyprenyl-3-methyl-5-hydroxy-6-metoxy-1,4-benzoquinol methylase
MNQHMTSTCRVCGGKGQADFSGTDLMFGGDRTFHYHRCGNCGLVYQHPLPDAADIAAFYPENYIVYVEPTRTAFTARERLYLKTRLGYTQLETPATARPRVVNDVIPRVTNGRLLDIGCGNGEYLLRMKSIGWQCKGVEFNDKAASICRRHGLDIFQGNLVDANLEDASFDFVTAHHLIEHVPDPHALMKEIARILRPGGTLLIRTPDSESLGRKVFGRYWYANDVPRHLYLYSEKNLTLLANQHGLDCRLTLKPVKPKLVLRSLDYKLGNRGRPSKKSKIRKWASKLYIPAAKLSRHGDELFMLFTRTQD